MRSFSLLDGKRYPIDLKLDKLWNQKRNGFFIELGANDGITQSNTAFFEFERNWKGLLIEPSKSGYNSCKVRRPKSICVNAGCVADDYPHDYIEGDFNGNLMSSVGGKRLSSTESVRISARTLSSIIDEHEIKGIDFLSLDTEGYELHILRGLNLNKHRPTYMLIEIYNCDYTNIVKYLEQFDYTMVSCISNYNHTDKPDWDGTHNDYLFMDTRTDDTKK